jgi:glycosyltransferase involved in cell wall biosynthesis
MKIAYITETAVGDRHAWSGTAHYVYQALVNAGHEVIPLGPARPEFLRIVLALINQVLLKTVKKRYDYRHSRIYSKAFGRIFGKKLKKINCDLALICGGTEYGAWISTNVPLVYVLDRTIQGALDYHLILRDLTPGSRLQSVQTDKRAMRESSLLIFSSVWAASHAIDLYGIPESKTFVIPFGANVDLIPAREEALKLKDLSRPSLLMIGTSWENKGAGIAVNAFKKIKEKFSKARLTIIGCEPPEALVMEGLTIIPFIDKNSPEGQRELSRHFSDHHFFILPTRFDCTPIVFCEASAYGIPVFSADTGGVRGHVEEGVNGFLLPSADDGEAYAERILALCSNPDSYQELQRSTRDMFEQKLNWTAWGNEFNNAVSSIV